MASMNKPAADSTNWTTAYTDNWTSIETNLIDKHLVTARGDLFTATGAGAPARQPVGNDNQVLIADSTQLTGLKWGPFASAAFLQSSTVAAVDSVQAPTNGFFDIPGMTLTVNVGAPGKVLILFNMSMTAGSSRAVIKIMRDSTDLRYFTAEGGYTVYHPVGFATLDSCGVGTHTFHVQWYKNYPYNYFYGDVRNLTVLVLPG